MEGGRGAEAGGEMLRDRRVVTGESAFVGWECVLSLPASRMVGVASAVL